MKSAEKWGDQTPGVGFATRCPASGRGSPWSWISTIGGMVGEPRRFILGLVAWRSQVCRGVPSVPGGFVATVGQVPLVADGTPGGKCRNPGSSAAGFHLFATNHSVSSFLMPPAHQEYSERCFNLQTLPVFLMSRSPVVSVPPGPAGGEEHAGGSVGRGRTVGPPSSEAAHLCSPCSGLGPSVWTGAHLPFRARPIVDGTWPWEAAVLGWKAHVPTGGWGRGDSPFGLTLLFVLGPARHSGGPQLSWGASGSGLRGRLQHPTGVSW